RPRGHRGPLVRNGVDADLRTDIVHRGARAPRGGVDLRRRTKLVLAIVIVGVAIVAGALPRLLARRQVRDDTAELAVRHVAVIRPERAAAAQKLVLPGSVQAYTSAPIFARATGYVKKWHADIGTRVKQGQLLAEIEVPEVEQQLQQAQGALASAQANLRTSEE